MATRKKQIPIHQWTHYGDKVLLVKCLNRDGTAYNGFIWPKEGPVDPGKCGREATCNSGGLFGWPWGLHIGDGRNPDACATWIVFAANPENVIGEIDGDRKAKAVPGEGGELPEVIYYGNQAGAMALTQPGRIAWIIGNSIKGASASGERGSASASG